MFFCFLWDRGVDRRGWWFEWISARLLCEVTVVGKIRSYVCAHASSGVGLVSYYTQGLRR